MSVFKFFTTGAGGGFQKDNNRIDYPINKVGNVSSNGTTVSLRVGELSCTINLAAGGDTAIVDGVQWADTADKLAQKLQTIFTISIA